MAHTVTPEKIVAAWEPSLQGVIRHVHPTKVPADGLYDALNCVYRDGTLQERPGYTPFSGDSLATRPVGALHFPSLARGCFQAACFQADAFQVAPDSHMVVAATLQKVFVFYNGTWHSLTEQIAGPFQADAFQTNAFQQDGSVKLAGSADRHARFATIEIDDADSSPSLYILIAGMGVPLQWNTKTAAVASVAGNPPPWKDVTVIADHVVYISEPYTFGWSDVLTVSSWPALNRQIKADQPYELVAVRNIGTLGGALYSTGAIWAVFAQPGSPSQRFRLEFRGYFDGPASPAALVDADGLQYRMTRTGRIASFDGTTNLWVVDGVSPVLRDDIDPAYAHRIWGAYYANRREVWFYYPRLGDNGEVRGVCILRLPDPQKGEPTHGAFPGRLALSMSTGCDRRGVLDDILTLAAESPQKVFVLTGPSDDGAAFSGFWQTGLVGTPGLETMRVDGSETFLERGAGYGSVTMAPVHSYALDNPAGSLGTAQIVDLTAIPIAKEEKGEDTQGRFFGRRYEFTTPITLRWRGARLAARKIE